mmetsp:Transcript_1293/g.1451  ORF Transcript_1293/g.1451 Transcript_1293/m.1451 type:complete len:115 (-) Transcript_1293:246-590(-)|eukprot:CAMPEP_0205803658 /NCGR_PEP_ID=MMETSP0205-20121125/6393_1 /ASSEMBLY_ACC=CAM_ASM_000278 /TAXON_ID=36767 /ORGANISM="Euplotes focardii, Strain TN1" /LENGTH=114 /DNA_ID=CAMNT_0053072119 /DNA_START=352 /DNA_END=696 /DNA_ORIENTATION=-
MADSDKEGQESGDPNLQKARDRADKNNKKGGTNAPPGLGAPKPGVDMNEINLDVAPNTGGGGVGSATGPGPKREERKDRRPGDDTDNITEDLDEYDDAGAPFFRQMVNRFPKTI